MALSGLEIFKHLPKTNCKDCGVPTCLAFAMKVAAGQAGLSDCPHISEAAKQALSEASAPPQQLVTIGAGDKARQVGQETVLYRHDDRFQRPTLVAIRIADDLDDAAIQERARKAAALKFERVGAVQTTDLVAVDNVSGSPERFKSAASAASKASGMPLLLMAGKPENLQAAGEALKAERPLLWPAAEAAEAAIPLAKELCLPLVLEAAGLDAVIALAEKARAAGLKELVLSPGRTEPKKGLEFLTQARRAAITKKFRPLGYPVAMLALDSDLYAATIEAAWYILKYAAVVVLDFVDAAHVLAVLTTRRDIYTDPQVPVKVQPGLHAVGDPGDTAPVLVTTNFALTYYSVEAEVEASRVPSYILSVDTEGTSVLTAWAADKFNAATISAALKASGLEGKVKHRKLLLPGLVAVLRASVEDESGWQALIGPKEATGIVSYLKNQWQP